MSLYIPTDITLKKHTGAHFHQKTADFTTVFHGSSPFDSAQGDCIAGHLVVGKSLTAYVSRSQDKTIVINLRILGTKECLTGTHSYIETGTRFQRVPKIKRI